MGNDTARSTYTVHWTKPNGFLRTEVYPDDLMGAVTLCQWLNGCGVRYQTCPTVTRKLDEISGQERDTEREIERCHLMRQFKQTGGA